MLTPEQEAARKAVIDAVKAWRETACAWPRHPMMSDTDRCDGENHLEGCPAELARQELNGAYDHLVLVGGVK